MTDKLELQNLSHLPHLTNGVRLLSGWETDLEKWETELNAGSRGYVIVVGVHLYIRYVYNMYIWYQHFFLMARCRLTFSTLATFRRIYRLALPCTAFHFNVDSDIEE